MSLGGKKTSWLKIKKNKRSTVQWKIKYLKYLEMDKVIFTIRVTSPLHCCDNKSNDILLTRTKGLQHNVITPSHGWNPSSDTKSDSNCTGPNGDFRNENINEWGGNRFQCVSLSVCKRHEVKCQNYVNFVTDRIYRYNFIIALVLQKNYNVTNKLYGYWNRSTEFVVFFT